MRAHLNIGSNLGDRRENLMQAVESLRRLASLNSPEPCFRVSSIVESEPWGYASDKPYLNIGVSFDTLLLPQQLLRETQAIERQIGTTPHRKPDGTYADRHIDIDLIFCDDARLDLPATDTLPALTLPHPRWRNRQFVITPLRQIDPQLYEIMKSEERREKR